MKSAKHVSDLTQGSIGKMLLLFFLPIAAGNLFQQFYNTADALIIAHFVGREALAAVGGSSAMVINVLIGFFTALSGGASVVISHAYGSGDSRRISSAAHTAIMLSIALAVICSVGGLLLAPAILRGMKTPEDTVPQSILYLRIYFCGILFNMLYIMGAAILRAVGDSKRPLYALIVCCVTNIVLDVTFVTVLHWGVAGVALATIISQFFSAVLVLRQLCTTPAEHRIVLSGLRFEPDSLRRMLKIGIPTGLQSSMYSISNLIIQISLNALGTVVVASWSMTGKIDGVYWAVSSALGIAIMNFTGQNYGAGKNDRIRRCASLGMIISSSITVFLIAAILLFGRFGLHFVIDDADVLECTRRILLYFVPYYLLWTLIEVFSAVLRGMGDTLIPVIINAIGICGLRMLWIAFVFPHWHSVKGLSVCYPVSWAVTAAAILSYYMYKRRRGALSD